MKPDMAGTDTFYKLKRPQNHEEKTGNNVNESGELMLYKKEIVGFGRKHPVLEDRIRLKDLPATRPTPITARRITPAQTIREVHLPGLMDHSLARTG